MKQTIMLTILFISTLVIADERYHPADTNQNNAIEQSEFDAYNQAWRNDTIWGETGKSVATNYLTRAGHLLLNGGAYQDSGGDMPMCWVSGQTVPDPYITNTIGMTFVYIEPGTFTMGSPLSEAEWEYAARAGSTTAFANGGFSETGCEFDTNLDLMGWYCGNADKKTYPVAQKQPNAWGIFDMHGNVYEW